LQLLEDGLIHPVEHCESVPSKSPLVQRFCIQNEFVVERRSALT
jgi:hypothetical protein